jgi:hypothetical protein
VSSLLALPRFAAASTWNFAFPSLQDRTLLLSFMNGAFAVCIAPHADMYVCMLPVAHFSAYLWHCLHPAVACGFNGLQNSMYRPFHPGFFYLTSPISFCPGLG